MFSGKNTGIFLTNPFEALKVAHQLTKNNKYFKFKVYKLKDYEEAKVSPKDIVRTYKQYKELSYKRIREADELLKKMHEETRAKQQKQNADNGLEK